MSFDPTAEITPRLPHYVRFRDLRSSGIVENWEQLSKLIERENFPQGRLLSPNVRAWTVDEITTWLASRPTERKAGPQRRKEAAAPVPL